VTHLRTTIRDKAAEILTGLATTGANVFAGRISALTDGELPGLVILTRDEAATDGATNGGPTAERVLQLGILARAQANPDELQDLLDTIAEEVEDALFAGTANLEGLAMMISPPLTQIELPQGSDATARPTGELRMVFPVTYRTRLGDASTQV